jgi:hypothetical protein
MNLVDGHQFVVIDKIYTSKKTCIQYLHYFLHMHVQTRHIYIDSNSKVNKRNFHACIKNE